MIRMILVAAAASAAAFSATSAYAAGAILGPMCLDGVTDQAMPAEQTVVADGVWTPHTYNLDPAAGSHRLTVFDRPIPTNAGLETCTQVIVRMKAAGATPVLSGTINQLKLRLSIFNGPAGNRLQIAAQDLDVTLGKVETGQRPIAGGTIDLKGSKLWIGNPTVVLSQPSEISGDLEIQAWNRRIVGAAVSLPGGLTYHSDLSPIDSGNLTIRLDLADGRAKLWKGELAGKPIQASRADADLDTLELKGASLNAASLALSARTGEASVRLADLKGDADGGRVPGPKVRWSFTKPTLTLKIVEGPSRQSDSGFAVHDPVVRQLTASAPSAALESATDAPIIEGATKAAFPILERSRITATSTWTNPTSGPLAPVFPSGALQRIDFNLEGDPAAPAMTGAFVAHQLSTAGIGLATAVVIPIPKTVIGGELVIPVHVDVPAASGSVTFRTGAGVLQLTGDLHGLFLDGRIFVPLPDVALAHFDVATNNFRFGVGAAIAASPIVAGAKPNFAGGTVDVANVTPLRVASASTGIARVVATTMVVGQPVFQVGDNGTAAPASFELKSDGIVKLDYDLAAGKVTVARARLHAQNIHFKMLSTPVTIDLDGTRVTDPEIQLDDILVEVDQVSAVKIQLGELRNLTISAARVEKTKALGYSGKLLRPVTIASFKAGRVVLDDKLLLGAAELKGLDLSIGDAQVDLGDGVSFQRAALQLKADAVRQVQLADTTKTAFDKASLSVSGNFVVHSNGFGINNATGTQIDLSVSGVEDALSGFGRLQIGSFTGFAESALEITFPCDGGSNLSVPIEYNFGFGGADIHVNMDAGSLSGDAATGPIGVMMHTKGLGAACHTKPDKKVLVAAAHGWTDGICTQVWPPKAWPCRWEWSTPEVSFGYSIQLAIRFVNLNVLMTNQHFYLGKGSISVCNIGAVALTPGPIIGGYSPQIYVSPAPPGAEDVVNALISAGFEAPQSLLATSIVSTASWLVSAGTTASGNVACIGQPL